MPGILPSRECDLEMIPTRNLILIVSSLFLTAGLAGADYLDPGSGPSYSEWRSYFSDPIFFSGGAPSRVDYSQYYPYFGSGMFREPTPLGVSGKAPAILGKVARKLAEERAEAIAAAANQSSATASPMYRRMINPEALPSMKNWTRTMDYARERSSVRVLEGGEWTVPQDVQKMY